MQDAFSANRAIPPDVCPIAPAEDRWHSIECPWRGAPFRTAAQDVYKYK